MNVQPVYFVINYAILLLNILNGIFCFGVKKQRRIPVLLFGVFLLGFNLIIYLHPVTAAMFEYVPVSVLWFIFLYFFNDGNFFAKSFIYFGVFYVTLYLYVTASFLAESLYPYGSSGYFWILFSVTLVLFLAYGILSWRYGKQICDKLFLYARTVEWAVYMAITILLLIVLGYAYFWQGIIWHPVPLRPIPYFLLLPTVMFGCFALIVTAILTTHEKARYKYEAEFASGIIATGREHYQKINEMYGKLRILRHDYKYHLNVTRKMIQAGDMEGADNYLTGMEQTLSGYELKSFCTNHVINALVADYAERCEKLKIQFDVSLCMPEALSIPDYDLCIILGNLLENAVEACEKLSQGGSIRLETQSTRNQLLFRVKNSFDGTIFHKDGMPFSKKPNGGFGLRSVREVIDGHGGDLLLEWDSNSFTAYVAVKLLEDKEKGG